MFAVGHLAIGYLTGKATSKLLDLTVNIPLLFLLSMLPDIDLLFRSIEHRGLTHSLVISSLIFLPAFIILRKQSLPYLAAFVQHALIGDYLTREGSQLLWPLTSDWYTLGIGMKTLANISIELTAFIMCLIQMLKTRDLQTLMKPHLSNLLLFIPITAIFFSAFSLRNPAPPALLGPHIAFIIIFTSSIIADLKAILKIRKLSFDLSRAVAREYLHDQAKEYGELKSHYWLQRLPANARATRKTWHVLRAQHWNRASNGPWANSSNQTKHHLANVAATGSENVYYHAEWTTTQNYPYSENARTQTVSVTWILQATLGLIPIFLNEELCD